MNRDKIFSEAIFDPSFKMEGPHLVAASAGTGKTYNIQNIYVRLVAEGGLRVPEIQVMTYTEAATKELRDRIRRVLSDFSHYLAGETGGMKPDEVERLGKLHCCINSNVPDGNVIRMRIELALMEFDQAAISTIHGFCRRALVRFAFETDSAFRAEFEDNKKSDLTERARDWWRTERKRVPDDLCGALSLDKLNGYAAALSQKADWQVKGSGDRGEAYLLACAKDIAEAYETDRSARETQTFDDLLRGLREALRNKDKGSVLAARLRDEFKAVLVDEFQDTDPVQYDIFRLVFLDPTAEPRPTLFFVGDPKQAIYSFRGGDIYTYKQAVETDDVKDNAYRLNLNFRSTSRIIDAVNMIFRDVRGPDGKLLRTFGDDAIGYAENLQSPGKAAALKIDGQDDPRPFRFVWVEKATDDRDAAIVDSVLAVLEEQAPNGLTPKDIAILVSSHENARTLRGLLRERGVPVVLQKSGNVFADNVAEELRIVLQAMAQMGGVGRVRAALATSFFSYAPTDLVGEKGNSTLADMIGKFGNWNRIWIERGFNAAFAALESDRRCDIRRRFAREPDGERKLADLLQIIDLASVAVRELGPAPELLVNWLTDRINNSQEHSSECDVEEFARQLESEDDAVKIMTMHYSKGLEFPVVIVPVTGGVRPSAPYFFHEGTQLISSVDPADEARAQEELDAEKTRLLYVAFTRASKRMIVVAAKALGEDGSPLSRLVANARKNGADNTDSPIAMSEFAITEESAARRYVAARRSPRLLSEAEEPKVFPLKPTKGSYSSLAPAGHGDGGDAHDFDLQTADTGGVSEGVHPIFAIGGGAKTGTCWHEILERIPFDSSNEAVRLAVDRAMRIHGVVNPGADDLNEKVDVVSMMIRKTLEYKILSPAQETFCLRQVAAEDRLSEWEFDFSSRNAAETTEAVTAILKEEWRDDPSKASFLSATECWKREIPKGFFKGFLDLLFRHGEYFYVVDWKSNVLNRRAAGFNEEGVTSEMAAAGYFFQYLLYSVVLHRFLRETLGERYSWERNFGGVRYYFLRGIAAGGASPVFSDRPGERLLDRLSEVLGLEGK